MDSNGIIAFYKKFFGSRELYGTKEDTQTFIDYAMRCGIDAFDKSVVDKYYDSPYFIEHRILQYVLKAHKIPDGIRYGSAYSKEMNATSSKSQGTASILADELLLFTLQSFIYTIFSLINDRSDENCERCIKNCVVFLDLQGLRKTIGVHNYQDVERTLMLPTNLMHMASDAYWMVWTFIVGHELYHLQNNQSLSTYQDEISADTFGYNLLIKMIEDQKSGSLPLDMNAFPEYLYLAPIMLFEYFRFLDFYRELCGQKICYQNHPSPTDRQDNIFSLYDCVPDSFNTETGNSILNSFLDAVDYLKEQIYLKKIRGKLEIGEIELTT